MELDVWRVIVAARGRLPRTWVRAQHYPDEQVLAVLLWAALHERSILWACQRRHWPMQARRRKLPHQSTMSRRLRGPGIVGLLKHLTALIQSGFDDGNNTPLRADGMPMAINTFSADPDAKTGWGAGEYQHGYKPHAVVANAKRLIGHEVEPMNTAESSVADRLLTVCHARGDVPDGAVVLADASYDSNPLHARARACGARLLAPRTRPGTGLSKGHTQDPGRVLCVSLLESDARAAHLQKVQRAKIEHEFGGLPSASGLYGLPPWVRTRPRVRNWTAAKIALNAARIAVREREHA